MKEEGGSQLESRETEEIWGTYVATRAITVSTLVLSGGGSYEHSRIRSVRIARIGLFALEEILTYKI